MLDSQPSPPRSRVHLGTPPCTPRAPGRAPVYTFQTLTLAHVGPSRALHSATPYLHTLYPHTTRAYLDPLCQSQPSSSQLDPLPSSRAYLDLDPLSISAYMCDLPCIAWSHDTRTCAHVGVRQELPSARIHALNHTRRSASLPGVRRAHGGQPNQRSTSANSDVPNSTATAVAATWPHCLFQARVRVFDR